MSTVLPFTAKRRTLVATRVFGAVLLCTACSDGGLRPNPHLSVVIVTAATLPTASLGSTYDVALNATGPTAPIVWSVQSGALPTGIELRSEGRLIGAPTDTGSNSFTLRAQSGSVGAAAAFTLRVSRPPLWITTTDLPNASLGISYSQFLDVDGGQGAVVWSLASGTLPPGITLSASGVVSGNASGLGTFPFVVHAQRGSLAAERSLSVQVVPPPLAIITDSLPPAKVGDAYSVQLERSGGIATASWSVTQGTLPSGMTLSPGGLLSGTPSVAGMTTFRVSVVSGAATVSRQFSLAITPAGYPSAVTVTMPGNIFVPFVVELQQGGTVTWSFGAEPHNVIFSTSGAPADINIVSNVNVMRTFPTAGFFRYDCTIHPGMAGIVDVKP